MRVYNVHHISADNVFYSVGAETPGQAIYLCEDRIRTGEPYTSYRARLARDNNGKPIETTHKGQFFGKQYIEHGIIWWECPDCGGDSFEYAGEDNYRCKECGLVDRIPFEED